MTLTLLIEAYLMIRLYNYFLHRGFHNGENKSVIKYLTEDMYIKIAPHEGNWNSYGDLYLYLFSNRFGFLMTELFKDKNSLVWSYLPRKLRKDRDGCLGMVMLGVNLDMEFIGRSILVPSEYTISVDGFLDKLHSMEGEKDIFNDLYNGSLGKLLILIEGMWVYLYFARKLGFTVTETLCKVENDNALKNHKKAWNLMKNMDADVIETFNECYDQISRLDHGR